MHVLLVHLPNQQTHGADHDRRVGGLDADDDIGEVLFDTDAQELHARLDHAGGRITIARHDAVAQRTVVHTQANGRMMRLADVEERNEATAYLLDLLGILLVGIFELLERTTGIDVIARIDADLLDNPGSDIGHRRIEMDIGNQGDLIAIAMNAVLDLLERQRLLPALGGESHDIGTSIDNALDLGGRSLDVVGIRIGHRLHPNGIPATQDDIADPAFGGSSSNIVIHKRTGMCE